MKALRDAARGLNPHKSSAGIPILLSLFSEPVESDKPGEEYIWLTDHSDPQNGLEDPDFIPYRAREHTDAHQLHPGGRFYPGQSPQFTRATMSGGLPTYSGITADDLHHFDQMDESPGLSNRYQRPSAHVYHGGDGSGPSA